MKYHLYLIVFLLFSTESLLGQSRTKFIEIETGVDFFRGRQFKKDYITNDDVIRTVDAKIWPVRTSQYKTHVGIRVGVHSKNDKLGMVVGLRATRMTSSAKRDLLPGYLNFAAERNGEIIALEISKINQVSSFGSLPVEIKYMPFRTSVVSVYFKFGSEVNFLLDSETTIQFKEPTTNDDQNLVMEKVGNPDSFYASIYGGGGIHVGKKSKPGVSLEFSIPSVYWGGNYSSLTTSLLGASIQLGFQMPL